MYELDRKKIKKYLKMIFLFNLFLNRLLKYGASVQRPKNEIHQMGKSKKKSWWSDQVIKSTFENVEKFRISRYCVKNEDEKLDFR